MVYASAEVASVAVLVGEQLVAQLYLVVEEVYGVVLQLVGGIERRDGGLAVGRELSGEVDGVERSGESDGAVGVTGNLTDEALGERVHEVEVGAVGEDVEVDELACRRDIAVDMCLCVLAVGGDGVDVDLLLVAVPVDEGAERSHASVFEGEVVDAQVGVGSHLTEGCADEGVARGLAAEVDGVEVDEVEDIGHVDILQVYVYGVAAIGGGGAVDADVLLSVGAVEGKLVEVGVLVVVDDVGGFHLPRLVVHDDVRGLHLDMCLRLAAQVLVEVGDGVELSALGTLLTEVVPAQRGSQVVVGGMGQQLPVHHVAVARHLRHRHLALQRVAGRGDADIRVAVVAVVVGQLLHSGIELQGVHGIVHHGMELERTVQRGVHAEEAL